MSIPNVGALGVPGSVATGHNGYCKEGVCSRGIATVMGGNAGDLGDTSREANTRAGANVATMMGGGVGGLSGPGVGGTRGLGSAVAEMTGETGGAPAGHPTRCHHGR